MLMCGRRQRRAGRSDDKARVTWRWWSPDGGDDGAEEEDGEEADARRMGRRSPGGWGRSGRKPPAFQGPTATDRWHGGARESAGRWTADSGRPVAAENPRWAEDGGRRGRRRSGRMTAAEEEEDTTTTMAADRGRKSG
jgi:hypothetical protein